MDLLLDIRYNNHYQHIINNWMWLVLIVTIACFLISEITRNYSQVDKVWSLMPIVYSWITVASFPSQRVFVMACLVTLWGLRLSYNFYRKGGYNKIPWKGVEDYRWKILRENPLLKGRFRYGLFNLLFISLFQNIVILLFSSPVLLAAMYPEKPMTMLDYIASIMMLTFIIYESIADNQQFRFHQEKFNRIKGERYYNESLKKGFLTEGLWRYARHPNFAAEQAIWISFYLFGVAASDRWINITIAGPLLLIMIFAGSTRLTENISGKKYNQYAGYQREIPMFIPNIFHLFKKRDN